MLEAFILSEDDDNELTVFLDEAGKDNPSILGYHYPSYRIMLEKIGLGMPLYIGLKNEAGNLKAMLPGFIKTQNIGSVYSSLPFFGPNAGVLLDKKKYESLEIHSTILSFLFDELENYNMISASFYSNFLDNSDLEIYEKLIPDNISIDKFTNYIPLQAYKLDSRIEYDLRKASKLGVFIREVKSSNDIDDIFFIYDKNCKDYGIPLKPKECLIELIEKGKTSKTTKTFVAEFDNTIIGALIIMYGPSTASYYLPCSTHEYRSYQPNSLLIDHAIKESINLGIKYWNWESSPSKESGVYKFKKKWGSIDCFYKILIKAYKEHGFYKQLGEAKISELFPYFFLYPFNKI